MNSFELIHNRAVLDPLDAEKCTGHFSTSLMSKDISFGKAQS